jgi:hypothetical protein
VALFTVLTMHVIEGINKISTNRLKAKRYYQQHCHSIYICKIRKTSQISLRNGVSSQTSNVGIEMNNSICICFLLLVYGSGPLAAAVELAIPPPCTETLPHKQGDVRTLVCLFKKI